MAQDASGSPKFSFASGANAAYIDNLYVQYKSDPESVDVSWQKFFEGYEFGASGDAAASPSLSGKGNMDEAKVEALINAYRRLGHLSSHLDPLGIEKPHQEVDLTPKSHGLEHVKNDQMFHPANLTEKQMTFGTIVKVMEETYCGNIGADYREINDIETVEWFQSKMESVHNKPTFSAEEKIRILTKLTEAEGFEQFLGRRFIGQKRFSLEGADSLIPMMDVMISEGVKHGVEETCIGMAHRGRLNVLVNFMGKSYESMLQDFEGSGAYSNDIDGDVKYHKGFVSDIKTASGSDMRLYLSPNPSHLECVAPVVAGFAKCRQRLLNDATNSKVLPIIMHGDAAIAGQGIVAETFNLSNLQAYQTGGAIHIIINNQVGFTTEPSEYRSSHYSSGISKMVRAPVLHVNADDPEAVAWCAKLAIDYRQKFKRDIVIDLMGYRRHGHNEGDEPAFSQPLMYQTISKHPTCLTIYTAQLVKEGVISAEDAKAKANSFKKVMQAAYEVIHNVENPDLPEVMIPESFKKMLIYTKVTRKEIDKEVKTGISKAEIKNIAKALTTVPTGFKVHKKIERLIENRLKMVEGEGAVDWGFGELLAMASIAKEGKFVRLTGQDVCRGTFTSRHAVFVDVETGKHLNTLSNLSDKQAEVEVVNSPLSEQGCLGFEFGYSVADRDSLVLWEAQFGDFANGAQIIIDQFISASEAKWNQTNNLVMLLPHGHEGQGPEHSSARPERFLQLCGNLNMQVINPTTPAQHFHALRRQTVRDFRKPLIVMTPKSLLRHPQCVSKLEHFEKGVFKEVLDDNDIKEKKAIDRIVVCSGKIYYEMLAAREENKAFAGIPIVRMEQLYPFPYESFKKILSVYPKLKEIVWTQEEPQNMGGWNFVLGRFSDIMKSSQKLVYVGRKNSGTPAEGSNKGHTTEQARIINDAFTKAAGKPAAKKKA